MPIPFDITERMMDAANLKNLSALARDMGITPQALSNYKKRGAFPAGLVIGFAQKHDLSVDWLLTGKVAGLSSVFGVDKELDHDELKFLGKALKVLRAPGGLGQVFRYSVDALDASEASHV